MKKRKTFFMFCLFSLAVIMSGCKDRGSEFGNTLPEQLFSMSWGEISEFSEDDFKNRLDEEGAVYEAESEEVGNSGTVTTFQIKTTTPFAGGDCIYKCVFDPLCCSGIDYYVSFETEEAFISGRKAIEEYAKKHQVKGSQVSDMDLEEDEMGHSYVVEISNENLDMMVDKAMALSSGSGEKGGDKEKADLEKALEGAYVYKMMDIVILSDDTSSVWEDFPKDKSYTNYKCMIRVRYQTLSENDAVYELARTYRYDVIDQKSIDLSAFQLPVSDKAMGIGMENILYMGSVEDEKRRKKAEEELKLYLYMAEKHNYNMEELKYFESDEDKKEWYLSQFHWDTDLGKIIESDSGDDEMLYEVIETENYMDDE